MCVRVCARARPMPLSVKRQNQPINRATTFDTCRAFVSKRQTSNAFALPRRRVDPSMNSVKVIWPSPLSRNSKRLSKSWYSSSNLGLFKRQKTWKNLNLFWKKCAASVTNAKKHSGSIPMQVQTQLSSVFHKVRRQKRQQAQEKGLCRDTCAWPFERRARGAFWTHLWDMYACVSQVRRTRLWDTFLTHPIIRTICRTFYAFGLETVRAFSMFLDLLVLCFFQSRIQSLYVFLWMSHTLILGVFFGGWYSSVHWGGGRGQ